MKGRRKPALRAISRSKPSGAGMLACTASNMKAEKGSHASLLDSAGRLPACQDRLEADLPKAPTGQRSAWNCRASAPLARGEPIGRPIIKRCLVRFGMANRSNVRPARPGRDFPAHRAICRVETHRSAEDDRNSRIENSTMRLVPGASTVSLRLKNSPASRLDLALARRNRACGRALGSPQALSSA